MTVIVSSAKVGGGLVCECRMIPHLAVFILGAEGAEPLDLQLLQAAAGHGGGRTVTDKL